MFSSSPCYEHINNGTALVHKSEVELKGWIDESINYLLKQKKLRILDSQEIQGIKFLLSLLLSFIYKYLQLMGTFFTFSSFIIFVR